jgi:tripartite-type tricarboxylate transporter receptor subunit TctC
MLMTPSFRETAMHRLRSSIVGWTTFAIATLAPPVSAAAQSGDFYAGKTIKILVGVEAGGTADVFVRGFSVYLKKHIPGNPTVIVQNMTGAGGSGAANFLAERAAPDALTIVFNPFHPLAQALGDPTLRARYEDFEYVGGVGDVRVNYLKSDAVPGGAKKPSDIMKADTVIVGAVSHADFTGTLAQLSLKVLGVNYKPIVGYRGGSDIFLAMQRGEVHYHNTSIGTFRSRSAAFIKSGEGIGVSYLVPVGTNGEFERNKLITEMPSYPDLYKEVHGKLPSGQNWDAFNWLTNQVGELAFIALTSRGAPAEALAALRTGFERSSSDPDYTKETVTRNGIPYSYVNVQRGQSIIRSLADVSPDVVTTLRGSIGGQN